MSTPIKRVEFALKMYQMGIFDLEAFMNFTKDVSNQEKANILQNMMLANAIVLGTPEWIAE